MKKLLPLIAGITFVASLLDAAPFTPFPGDGTTREWCDVISQQDTDSTDHAVTGSLRDRIELYNKPESQGGRCFFYIFFTFGNRSIVLKKPLLFERILRDYDSDPDHVVNVGTYISGYGSDGVTDKLNNIIDARKITQDHTKCAFMMKGGVAAKQQIHGITILVTTSSQAICDEMGNDLMNEDSMLCIGKKAKECDFNDVTILTPPPTPPVSTPSSAGGNGTTGQVTGGSPLPSTTAGTNSSGGSVGTSIPTTAGNTQNQGTAGISEETPSQATAGSSEELPQEGTTTMGSQTGGSSTAGTSTSGTTTAGATPSTAGTPSPTTSPTASQEQPFGCQLMKY